MTISRVRESDIGELRELIINTCKVCFKDFYPNEWVDYTIKRQTIERLRCKTASTHFYVARECENIIGCVAIDFDKVLQEAWLLSFFVDVKFQNKGIGKSLLKAIEQDDYYINAKKILVPSSIPALPFYIKNGFKHKDNKLNFQNGEFLLEKIK